MLVIIYTDMNTFYVDFYLHPLLLLASFCITSCSEKKSQPLNFTQEQIELGKATPKDYFDVTNEIYATVFDSVASSVHYDLKGVYCGPRIVDKIILGGSTFRKPFSYSNLNVQKNTDADYPSNLYWIHLLNDSTIQVHYGLYCLPRRIYRPGHPPPPDNRPTPFLNIAFDCPIRQWKNIHAKIFIQREQSSTKTAFVAIYPYLPQNTSHKAVSWAYKSTVKVFKDGNLYREYVVSNKIPNLTKVHSSFVESEKRLLVEIIE
jgi:hypothetical protein